MDNKWIVEPIDEEVIGWNILKNDISDDEVPESIAVVIINDDIQESKDNAALISTAPELLSACKKALSHIDKNSLLYDEIEYLVNKAEGIEGDIETLTYFDDMPSELYPESVINIDFENNKCTYVSDATMEEVFTFQDFGDNVGLMVLNISGDFLFDDSIDEYSLRYPVGHLLSLNVFEEFIEFMSIKYPKLKDFMADFDSKSNDISLRSFIEDIFFDEFSVNYQRELTLNEYLSMYPLIIDTEELYMDLNLPKFLDGCPHAMHPDMTIKYNGQSIDGIVFYKENDDKFFIYNQAQKSVSFFMIPNVDKEKDNTILNFIDLIQY